MAGKRVTRNLSHLSEDYKCRKNFAQSHGNFELKMLMSAFFTQNSKKVPKTSDFVSKLWGVAGKRQRETKATSLKIMIHQKYFSKVMAILSGNC